MSVRRAVRIGCALGLALGGLCGAPPAAEAVDLTVQLDSTAAGYAQQVGLDVPKLQMQLESELRQYFQLYRIEDFLRDLGDGQSFTNRGLGVDYAADWDAFMVGVGANVAFNRNSAFGTAQDHPVGKLFDMGKGLNLTVMAGLNLNLFGWGALTLYANYFVYRHQLGPFEGRTTNFGLHAQIKLFRPEDTSLVRHLFKWGGVDITTGVEQEKGVLWLTGTTSTVVQLAQVSAAAAGSSVKVDASGDISFYTRAVTMPIEVTTNVRLLRLLSLYAGAGYDLKIASAADGYMAAGAMLTGRVSGGPQNVALGAARVEVSQQGRLSAGELRVLGGAQVNLFLVKLFIHGNLLVHDPVLFSLGGGVRLAY